MDSTKRCTACGEEQPVSLFGKHAYRKDGLNQCCRLCARARARERYRVRVTRFVGQAPVPSKLCASCRDTKPATAFYRDASRSDGLTRQCKTCTLAHRHATSGQQPATRYRYQHGTRTRREYNLIKLYGTTLSDFDRLSAEQGHRCALCGEIKKLCVDHSHVTGIVRGLLCIACNAALGLLTGDSVERWEAVRRYLVGGFHALELSEKHT